MRPQFKFTLRHNATDEEPPFPPLSEWRTRSSSGSLVDWTEGVAPSVILPSNSGNILDPISSELLYADYPFVVGREYTITVDFTKVLNTGVGTNPRTLTIRILDDAFASQFDDNVVTNVGANSSALTFIATADCTKVGIEAEDNSNVTITVDSVTKGIVTDTVTTLVIPEPIGWKTAVLKLDRDPKFHSLIKYFEAAFTFYGAALRFIWDREALYGPDVKIGILIEISFSPNDAYETLFDGLLDVSDLNESSFGPTPYKAKIPIIRNDLWARFINHLDTPVDVRSDVNLFGTPVTPMQFKTLNLPSQKIRYRFSGTVGEHADFIIYDSIPANGFGQIDFAKITLDEIKNKFTLPREVNAAKPVGLFAVEFAGDYSIDVFLSASTAFILGASIDAEIDAFIQINADAPIMFTRTNIGGVDSYTTFEYSDILSLNAKDTIRIYFEKSGSTVVPDWGMYGDSYLNITADTVFLDSTCQAFHLHDVFTAIVDRISTTSKFYSEFLGHTSFTDRAYDAIGDAFRYMLTKGLHIRGYTLTEKAFFQAFMDCYESTDAILNIGLGYEIIDAEEVIRLEKKEDFYDASATSAIFYNVKLERSYDKDFIIKKTEVGYSKSEAESVGVMDDPQWKDTYVPSKFATIGKALSIISDFITAGQATEKTRRQGIEKNKDWKLDDDTFMISIDPAEVSADVFTPELDENFSNIGNLINPETRYNLRLWPVWNYLRWFNVVGASVKRFTGSVLRFVSGKGNYDAEAQMNIGSESLMTDGVTISQRQNIPVSIALERGDPIHTEELFKCTIPMSWTAFTAIDNDRKKGIALSRSAHWEFASGEPCQWEAGDYVDLVGSVYFIKNLAYRIYKSEADLIVWPKIQLSS